MGKQGVINPGDNPYQYGQSLPILPPEQPPITEMDWRKVEPPPLFKLRPPKGAPNVVIVLMDQSCYADPQTFGGRIRTPTLDGWRRTASRTPTSTSMRCARRRAWRC